MDRYLAELVAKNVEVNNLFQLPGGGWRCNLRKQGAPREPGNPGSWTHEFADAPTWNGAVEKALKALGAAESIPKAKANRWQNAWDRLTIAASVDG